ncbi:WAS/WASL-interacting protein family member 3-like [Penaeus monodon]|uniref:WAS/WASL-interacting protein family member 3-like n=1 Tax=Penaeus monodon TaxID=6687 RepID=UPI0018A6DF21|nr:WAS/WASL-interacting protein family member 3-like [Penaeus monodon]
MADMKISPTETKPKHCSEKIAKGKWDFDSYSASEVPLRNQQHTLPSTQYFAIVEPSPPDEMSPRRITDAARLAAELQHSKSTPLSTPVADPQHYQFPPPREQLPTTRSDQAGQPIRYPRRPPAPSKPPAPQGPPAPPM